MSCFRKNLETNALGFFGFFCFSFSPQLMLILSINSLLKVNSLLLGFLSVVLGFLLIDLESQALQNNGVHCLYHHFSHPTWSLWACVSNRGPPWPVRNSWDPKQPDHTRALVTSSALSPYRCCKIHHGQSSFWNIVRNEIPQKVLRATTSSSNQV